MLTVCEKTKRILIKKIIITEVESWNSGKKHVFQTYEEAEKFARTIANERERYEMRQGWKVGQNGYYKTDFTIKFEDGEEYIGRLDIKPFSCDDNDTDIREHICDHLKFWGGYLTPETIYDNIGWEDYLSMLKTVGFEYMMECRSYYEKYEFGQDEVK